MLALSQNIILYLKVNVPASYGRARHPLGNVQMSPAYANSVATLLLTQPAFKAVELWEGQRVDYNLDLFRRSGFDLGRGHIGRWPCYCFPVQPRLWEAWLEVEAEPNNFIVVNRTTRYRNPRINYNFLARRPECRFVGVASEHKDFCQQFGKVEWIETANYLELARVIKGSRLFVGGQSSAWAIAEALKVPRILEVCPAAPTTNPNGPNGWEAWDQPLFEQIFSKVMA